MIRLKHLRVANFKALRDVALGFPESGSVLIEGLNESGKSTLFEAVYFALYGRPLVSDIESTVRYQTKEAFVELAFMVDATEIVVNRSIRIGRQNRAKLTILRPGEPPEVVAQLAAINRRVPEELGRLDGETLLNSCFVEQKKLQRLEGLDAASRQRSLLRLLNLEGLGELENQFKLRGQDEESIRIVTQRRDLAQIQLAIPMTEAELARTDRRLAARRILAGLERIAGFEKEIVAQQSRRTGLQAQQQLFQGRLDRVARLKQTEAEVGGILQAHTRRLADQSTAERLQRDLDDLVRERDVDLPVLRQRLDSIHDVAAQLDGLEALQVALGALREGASESTLVLREDERATRLQADCATVGEQLGHAIAVHLALQRLDQVEGQIRQQSQVAQTIAELAGQRGRLQGLERDVPADRERAWALLEAAHALEVAGEESTSATRARVQAIAFQDTVDEVRSSRGAQAAALHARDAAVVLLQAADTELRDAQAASARAVGPALRAWIAARGDCERADQARRDEVTIAADTARADEVQQAAEAAAKSSTRQTILFAGGAVVGLALGLVLLLLVISPAAGLALVLAALAAGALGMRALAAQRKLDSATEDARLESASLHQRQTEVRAVIAASAAVGPERLAQAEDMLRAMGQSAPADLCDAQRLLADAREQDQDAELALDRVRLAQAELSRLTRVHGVAEMRLSDGDLAVEASAQRLEEMRSAAGAEPDADPVNLGATALQHLLTATEQLAAANAHAMALLANATPQGLRVEAASLQRRIEQTELELTVLPDTIARLDTAEKRMVLLAEQIDADSASLATQVQALDMGASNDLATLRPEIERLESETREADLRQEQARLNTHIGAAQAAAQQHRHQAASAWQQAGEQATQLGPQYTGPLRDLSQAMLRIAQRMSAESTELDGLGGRLQADRNRLAEQAARIDEPLDRGRLRSAEAEVGIQQRQMQTRIAKLPAVQAQLDRARTVLVETDAQIAAAWAGVDTRLAELDIGLHERDASALQPRLQRQIGELDEPGTRMALDGVIADIADADASIRQWQSQLKDEQHGFAHYLRRVGLSSAAVERAELELLIPEMVEPELPDEDTLGVQREHLLGQLSHLGMTRQELEGALDLIGVVLDLMEAEAELARQLRARLVKQRATSIITQARVNMINRVLPGTEQNLRLLLPHLTADRYCDAKLDSSYKLTVWDTAAQRYVEKDIFSGGTRDQFSLALRLAFALATLPQELGTTPGFIFLDEPLSAFDVPRTDALVQLLTHGQIARSFAQIFLISHSRSFDPDLFGYYVRMEAGRVAETNLPRPSAEALLAVQSEPAAA